MDAVLGEGNTHRVADAVIEERANADGALDPAILAVASLRDTEMQRIIPVGAFFLQPISQQAVGGDHHLGVARLHREK